MVLVNPPVACTSCKKTTEIAGGTASWEHLTKQPPSPLHSHQTHPCGRSEPALSRGKCRHNMNRSTRTGTRRCVVGGSESLRPSTSTDAALLLPPSLPTFVSQQKAACVQAVPLVANSRTATHNCTLQSNPENTRTSERAPCCKQPRFSSANEEGQPKPLLQTNSMNCCGLLLESSSALPPWWTASRETLVVLPSRRNLPPPSPIPPPTQAASRVFAVAPVRRRFQLRAEICFPCLINKWTCCSPARPFHWTQQQGWR